MADGPGVSAEVVERLARIVASAQGWPDPDDDDRDSVRDLVAHLRSHPEDAAAVLGGHVEWGVAGLNTAPLTQKQARMFAGDGDVVNRRVLGPWTGEAP